MCFRQIVFGAYNATYRARVAGTLDADGTQDLGITEGVWEVQNTPSIRTIQSDFFGDADVEGIIAGMNVGIVVVFSEWSEGIMDAVWPFGETLGNAGKTGRCMSDNAGELTLIAVTGTPAAAAVQSKTWYFSRVSIQPGHTLSIPLGNQQRLLAMAFKAWPEVDGTDPAKLNYYTHLTV